MITWIQVLLQKHHKIIFSVLLFVIIIAFVFTIGSSIPFFGGREGYSRSNGQNFYGYNLADPNQMAQLQRQAVLDLNLAGEGVSLDFKMCESAYLQHVAKKMCINRISDGEFKNFVESVFQKEDGSFNSEALDSFKQKFMRQMNVSDEQFAAMLEKIAIERKVQKLLVGPGYATDAEIEDYYCLQNGVWNLFVASLPYASFDPQTKFTDEDLQKFFDANKESFRIPDAMGFDVVFLAAKDFPPEAEEVFTDEEIKNFYEQTKSKYLVQDEKGFNIKKFEDAKDEVVKNLKKDAAARRALSAAHEIVGAIYNSKTDFASGEFKRILEDENLSIKSLPLLRKGDRVPGGLPREVAMAAFDAKLSEDKFYCDPIGTEDGAYLVFFRESKPSYIPQLGEARAQVEKAYLESKKREAFAAKGRELSEKLRGEVAKGGEKVFAEISKNSGFDVQNLEKFTFANAAVSDVMLYNALGSALPRLSGGDVSDMLNIGGTGYIVYAKSFEKPNLEAADLKSLSSKIAANFAWFSADGILNAKFSEQLPQKASAAE